MRQAASHPLVEFRGGLQKQLPDASVDLVFQSFHWFDPRQSLQVFHRILKPSGRLVLVWNHLDRSDEFGILHSLSRSSIVPNPLTRFMAPVLNLEPSASNTGLAAGASCICLILLAYVAMVHLQTSVGALWTDWFNESIYHPLPGQHRNNLLLI